MKINGTEIMEFEYYDPKLMRKILKKGNDAVKNRGWAVSSEEKKFLYVLSRADALMKFAEGMKKDLKFDDDYFMNVIHYGTSAAMLANGDESELTALKHESVVIDSIAAVLLFFGWNAYRSCAEPEDEMKTGFILNMKYDAEIQREALCEAGIYLQTKDRGWFFDALAAASDALEKDVSVLDIVNEKDRVVPNQGGVFFQMEAFYDRVIRKYLFAFSDEFPPYEEHSAENKAE